MPIADFLDGESFDPEALGAMNAAFKDICTTVGLNDKSDKATELVARRLIRLAKAGERDAERLRTAVLASLRAG
jgi:hypothetical protein